MQDHRPTVATPKGRRYTAQAPGEPREFVAWWQAQKAAGASMSNTRAKFLEAWLAGHDAGRAVPLCGVAASQF